MPRTPEFDHDCPPHGEANTAAIAQLRVDGLLQLLVEAGLVTLDQYEAACQDVAEARYPAAGRLAGWVAADLQEPPASA